MTDSFEGLPEDQKAQKIQSLRDMITSAERTIHGAKAMLLQIEGKKKAGRKKKVEDTGDGHVVQGTFDGQVMIGTDGKQYPVPANYASKSKLVEGDLLKLTISSEGFFIYKQIGPVPRQNKIGIVGQDTSGNYFIDADSKNYRVLLASVTYFKANPGDEVALVTAQGDDTVWASIESVLQHNHFDTPAPTASLADLPVEKPMTASGMIAGADTAPSTMSHIAQEINTQQEPEKEVSVSSEVLVDDVVPSTEKSQDTSQQSISQPVPDNEVLVETAPETPTQEPANAPITNPYVAPMEAVTPQTATQASSTNEIVNEWVPDIDEIEREIRAEMGLKQPTQS